MTRRRSGSREALRFWHDAYQTEQAGVEWLERVVRFRRDIEGPGIEMANVFSAEE